MNTLCKILVFNSTGTVHTNLGRFFTNPYADFLDPDSEKKADPDPDQRIRIRIAAFLTVRAVFNHSVLQGHHHH